MRSVILGASFFIVVFIFITISKHFQMLNFVLLMKICRSILDFLPISWKKHQQDLSKRSRSF